MLDEATAERLVTVGYSLQHITKGQPVLFEACGIDHHLELFGEAAPGIDFADTDDRAQPIADVPVMRRLGDHRVDALAGDDVLIDFAEGRRDRAEDGLEAFREARSHVGHPFGHQLARKVGGHIIAEDDRHDGESELRERPHLLGPGHAHQRCFDGIRHALLDFGRRQTGGLGDDDHLVVCQIGKRLDREIAEGHDAGHHQHHQRQQNEGALSEGRTDEALDETHATPPRRRRALPART